MTLEIYQRKSNVLHIKTRQIMFLLIDSLWHNHSHQEKDNCIYANRSYEEQMTSHIKRDNAKQAVDDDQIILLGRTRT
jgi:hypothetical protein